MLQHDPCFGDAGSPSIPVPSAARGAAEFCCEEHLRWGLGWKCLCCSHLRRGFTRGAYSITENYESLNWLNPDTHLFFLISIIL